MPQYTFTAKPELIESIEELAEKITPKPSISKMIVHLLEIGIREQTSINTLLRISDKDNADDKAS